MTGAGDGNRTHVRSLGSFYIAIIRRPLFRIPIHYNQQGIHPYRNKRVFAYIEKVSFGLL